MTDKNRKLKDINLLPSQTRWKKPQSGLYAGLEEEPDSLQELIQKAIDEGDLTVGASVNAVQSDWEETDTAKSSYIKNKPLIFPGTNISNSNLTLTGNRILSGDSKTLSFLNLSEYSVESDSINLSTLSYNNGLFINTSVVTLGSNGSTNFLTFYYTPQNNPISELKSTNLNLYSSNLTINSSNTTVKNSDYYLNQTVSSSLLNIYDTFDANGFTNLSSSIGFGRSGSNTNFYLYINKNTSKLADYVLTLVDPVTGRADWKPLNNVLSQNLGNTNLTLTADRTVSGASKKLTFNSLNEFNVTTESFNTASTNYFLKINNNTGASVNHVLTLDNVTTGQASWKPIASITDTNLGNSDLSISGMRTVNGNGRLLSFNGLGTFEVTNNSIFRVNSGQVILNPSSLFITGAPIYNASNNDVLTLINSTTGEVQFRPPTAGTPVNLSNTNLTLTGDRIVSGNNNQYLLNFQALNSFNVNSTFSVFNTQTSTFNVNYLRIKIDSNSTANIGDVLTLDNVSTGQCTWKTIPNTINYSTSPQKVGRKWIDNKDVWEVSLEIVSAGTSTVSAIIPTIDKVIDIQGTLTTTVSNNSVSQPIQGINNSGSIFHFNKTTKSITTSYPCIITIRYTIN